MVRASTPAKPHRRLNVTAVLSPPCDWLRQLDFSVPDPPISVHWYALLGRGVSHSASESCASVMNPRLTTGAVGFPQRSLSWRQQRETTMTVRSTLATGVRLARKARNTGAKLDIPLGRVHEVLAEKVDRRAHFGG